MRIIALALKDLSQLGRDKRSLLFLVVMPIVFTIFLGIAYRKDDKDKDNRIPLAVVNPEPGAALNQALLARLEESDAMRVQSLSETDALNALRKGEVAGVLKIPSGFSDQASAGNEAGVQLELITGEDLAQGQSLYQLLKVPIAQLLSAVEVSRETVDIVGAQNPSAEQRAAFEFAWNRWDEVSQVSLVKIEQAVGAESSDWTGGNPYNQSSPGMLVQFAIFGLITAGQLLVQEKKSRTLQRLITTAMKPWEIVAGHTLAMFTMTFLQTTLLVVFGQLALDVNYAREPLGVLLVSVALGLWIASMGLLIGVAAKDEQQVTLYAMAAMFVLSAMGGVWFPLEAAGGAFAAIGKALPSAWAMTGFQNILIRGLGLDAVWTAVAMILSYALGFFLLAVWRFRKMDVA